MTSQPNPRHDHSQEQFNGLAALLAIILPGLGHAHLGERRRGIQICAGVLGLFLAGLLIGGIDVVDSREDFVWFMGEALVGPVAVGVNYVHQHYFKVIAWSSQDDKEILRTANPDETRDPKTGKAIPATPGHGPPNIKSFGRVNELGTLFCTIAGMMNLICIIDVAFRPSVPHGGRRRGPVGGGAA